MIFYFSGTGNTRWAAQMLADKIGEKLYCISDMNEGLYTFTLEEGERIGFCFPVHGWQPPHIVRTFIRHLTITNAEGHYCYALCTCGDSIGRSMEILNKELGKRGLIASSVFSLVMPESYVCLPFMYTDKPEREKRKIDKAKVDLEYFSDLIISMKRQETLTKRGLAPWTFSHVIGEFFNRKMITDKKFSVDTDLCIHCGKCQRVCPTDNLVLEHGLPEWQHNGKCTCCLACYHHCPKHAINYGKITRRRGQYYFGHESL